MEDRVRKAAELFEKEGYFIVYSRKLRDKVAVVKDLSVRKKLPRWMAAYTPEEIRLLKSAGLTRGEARKIHEAKKIFGGTIVEVRDGLEDGNDRPDQTRGGPEAP